MIISLLLHQGKSSSSYQDHNIIMCVHTNLHADQLRSLDTRLKTNRKTDRLFPQYNYNLRMYQTGNNMALSCMCYLFLNKQENRNPTSVSI